jgi:hypothetical protein
MGFFDSKPAKLIEKSLFANGIFFKKKEPHQGGSLKGFP